MEKRLIGKKWIQTGRQMIGSIVLASLFILGYLLDRSFGGALTERGAACNRLHQSLEWWRAFAPTFLHVSLVHLAFNMGAILLIGHTVERRFGTAFFLSMYVSIEILTNVLQCFMSHMNNEMNTVGASCGIYGLLAALIVLLNKDLKHIVKEYKSKFGILRASLIAVYLSGFYMNAFSFFGHLIGFAAGTAITTVYVAVCSYKSERATIVPAEPRATIVPAEPKQAEIKSGAVDIA